ncbi:MAG: XrtA system polysaccharide deacetylase [Candidatus Thiodiazotropha sp.]
MSKNQIANSVSARDDIVNAMTVDVEDYFQVSAFAKEVSKDDWSNFESRVERNTEKCLEIFSDREITATFFVLGWIAERYPQLVRTISEQGHEIACHGYSHDLVYNQSIDLFTEETKRSKNILQDIVGQEVVGYRAASYSITKKSIWALDVLEELGFKYDSSVFPIIHDRYGIPNAEINIYTHMTNNGNSIIEIPLSTIGIANKRLPIGGGGYFRLFPYWLTRAGLKHLNVKNNRPIIFYLHPWELDPGQPRIKSSLLSEFRHYINLEKVEDRLNRLIDDFRFSSISSMLSVSNIRD